MKKNDIEKSLKKSCQWMAKWAGQPQMKKRFHDDPLKRQSAANHACLHGASH